MVVREDSLTLFGFADEDEKQIFELVQTASGVGPRLAQAMLAVHWLPTSCAARSRSDDVKTLTRVPGHRPEGRPADHPRAEGPDRRAHRSASWPRRRAPAAERRGATRCSRAGRARLVDQGGRAARSTPWPEAEAGGHPRRRRAAPRRPAHAEQGLSRWTTSELEDAELAHLPVRSTAAEAEGDERAVEAALRPAHPGRGRRPGPGPRAARRWSSRRPRARGRAPDHVLLSGPPGLGKTTLAMIIAAEMSAPLRLTSGPAITHAGDLAAILSGLNEGDVLFVDEIHRMSRPAEEMLYMAMEDFRVDVIIGKGPGATAIPLEIPPFTLVGATTRAGLLPGPLRDRFGFTAHLEFYEPDELERIVHRSAGLLGVAAHRRRAPPRSPRAPAAPRASPTGCCAGSATTPRCAPTASSPCDVARAALDLFEVDESGLDRLDRAVLDVAVPPLRRRPGRASRTLAVAVGEERETVEEVAEPFLVREGLLARTPRGRVATPAAWQHLGLEAPPGPPESPEDDPLFDD